MNGQVILWGLVMVASWVLIGQLTQHPRKTAWRLAQSAAFGFALMFAANWLSSYTHFSIPFNPATALTTGLLGAPGVIAVAAVKWMALV